jgi:outer membrane protein TolC
LAQRPDIYAAKWRTLSAANRINVAKARFFPDINLNLLFSYQSVGLGHLFDRTSQNNGITGAVDLPIFDAGLRRANLGEKFAEYDLAVAEYNRTLLTALREVADQQHNLHAVADQLSAQDGALNAVKHNYKLFTSRYNHGVIDYMEVLEVKQLLLKEQAAQVNLQARQMQTTVAMIKALGGTEFTKQG